MLTRRLTFAGSVLAFSLLVRGLPAQLIQQTDHPTRCGTPEMDPLWPVPEIPGDCAYSSNNPAASYSPSAGAIYTIPVWFHVIRNNSGTGNVSLTQLQNQIAILNEDFRAMAGTPGAGGVDTRIQFVLAGSDYSNNNTWYRDRGTYYNTLARDPHRYCNVYTNLAGGNLGYVPNVPQSGTLVGTNADRIVVLWSTVGRNAPYGAPYNQGRTLTHEMGHYLGLYHTFQGGCTNTNCNTQGDLICDTPAEASAHFGCAARDSCSSAGADPTLNYMDYSDDLCMNQFTESQARRLRCTLTGWRPLLYTSSLLGGYYERHVLGNPASYSATDPQLGSTWHANVDLSTTGHTMAMVFASGRLADIRLPNGFRQLIDTASGVLHLGTVTNANGFDLAIPADPALEGMLLASQAMHVGGRADFALSNAVDLVLHR